MKAALILALLFCAAFAAPAEDLNAVEPAAEELVAVADAAAPGDIMMAAAEDSEADGPGADVRFNPCPVGWYLFEARCYLFVGNPTTWYNAEDYCNNFGASLASASSSAQYRFMQQLVETGQKEFAWLGGFYLENRWLWINREGMHYSNWYNQNSPLASNSCIYLRIATGFRNQPCLSSHSFICSKSLYGC